MKWERRLAIVVIVLIFVLVARGLWLPTQDEAEIPVTVPHASPEVIEQGYSYYPVYFPTDDAEFLIPEFRIGQPTIEQVLKDLEEGPRFPFLVSVLPPETEIVSYAKQGSILFVNFSHHLVTNHPGGSRAETLTTYGIVNSLVGVEGIEKVQILVNNERLHTLVGHILVDEPLGKDYSIIGAWGN